LAIDVAVRRDAWRPRRIQGIGGLGHLGVQFANKFGYKVAAIGRGVETAALVKKFGAGVSGPKFVQGRIPEFRW